MTNEMTNKEAAEILTAIKNTPYITWTNGADIALDLAIKALYAEQEWSEMRKERMSKCDDCGIKKWYTRVVDYHIFDERDCPYECKKGEPKEAEEE